MYDYLLRAFISLCFLPHGLLTEDCYMSVLAKRDIVSVPEGGSLSLSCDVQTCGDTWTWNWMQTYSDKPDKNVIQASDRHTLTNDTLSANTTRLFIHFLSVNKSDEGLYACTVQWGPGATVQGHYVYVNVTAAVLTKRTLLHRLLVCGCACVCPVVVLLLARCLRSEVRPQPLPRPRFIYRGEHRDQAHPPPPARPVPKKRTKVSYKAAARSEQSEVVYADISQDALNKQEAVREPASSTVYSSVRFS